MYFVIFFASLSEIVCTQRCGCPARHGHVAISSTDCRQHFVHNLNIMILVNWRLHCHGTAEHRPTVDDPKRVNDPKRANEDAATYVMAQILVSSGGMNAADVR